MTRSLAEPRKEVLADDVDLYCGDCLDIVKTLSDNSIDSVVTDPPYALVSIGKRFGADGAAPAKAEHAGGAYARASAGFMGKQWDTGEVAFSTEFWADVLRVLKPGAHVAAFGGTRSYHRLACAIEDAGFEIRDQLAWCYGTGFPKSHDVGNGWGTALKPAWEPICLARKPLSEKTVAANCLRWGTGAINVDGCRVAVDEDDPNKRRATGEEGGAESMFGVGNSKRGATLSLGRFPANLCHDGSQEVLDLFPETKSGVKRGGGYGRDIGVHEGGQHHDGTSCFADSGSAARFFYCAKASKNDRSGSKHPTVKPIKLMQWLCRLITPPGGVALDLFAGSGTTGAAARREGFRAILCEREDEYVGDIIRRISQPEPIIISTQPDAKSPRGMFIDKPKPMLQQSMFGDSKASVE